MAVADGFHVDTNGNLWLGSNRETFDATTRSEAPFYVYANGDLVANSGTFSVNLSAAGGTFSGDLSAAGGTFTGNLSAAGGTFSGDLSASGGTFTGTLSGVDGTFTGTISANNVTGGTLDFDSVTASNLDFTSLSVQAGDIVAQIATDEILGKISNGAISDAKLGNITANKISGGTIDAGYFTGSAGFTNLTASSIGITGAITATSSLTAGSFVNSGSYIRGTEFRGSGTTVDIHRNSTSNGIRISGSGSGAYLYGYSSSGAQQIIYSPFSGVSDERLKENVVDLTLGLEEINALRPVTFDWKSTQIEDVPTGRYGFIAQEVESVVPSMISTEPSIRIERDAEDVETEVDNFITLDDGTEVSEWKRIDEKPLLYMLVKAVQELSEKNEELTARIEVLEG